MYDGENTFLSKMGDSPKLRVLNFLLEHQELDYSKSQVSEKAKVSRVTLEPIWHGLIEDSIIAKTRNVGRARMYMLNVDHPFVRDLQEFHMKINLKHAVKDGNIIRPIMD